MTKSALENVDDAFYHDLHQVLLHVLNEQAPEEAELFNDVGPELVKQYVDSKQASGTRGISFEFSPLIEASMLSVHLIVATVALIEMCTKIRQMREERSLRSRLEQEWKRLLVKEGMTPELASLIPLKYSPELLDFITKYRITELHQQPNTSPLKRGRTDKS
jgi:hypothetical protein